MVEHVPDVEESIWIVLRVEHGEEDGEDHHQDLCQQGPHYPRGYTTSTTVIGLHRISGSGPASITRIFGTGLSDLRPFKFD